MYYYFLIYIQLLKFKKSRKKRKAQGLQPVSNQNSSGRH